MSNKGRGTSDFEDPVLLSIPRKKKTPSFSHSFTLKLKDPQSFKKGGPLCIGVTATLLRMACRLADSMFLFMVCYCYPFSLSQTPFWILPFFFSTSFGFSFFLVWNSGPPSKAKWKSQNFSTLFSRYVTLSLTLCRISLSLELLLLQI